MKEGNKIATKNDIEEAESNEPLDDSTRQVLDDYSQKFLNFIQQEKEKVRKQALQESEKLLAETQKKGRLAYEETIRQANKESAELMSRSEERANRVTVEAERLFQVVMELRDKTQKDVEELRQSLQRDSDALIASIQQANKAMAESKASVAREFEASAATVAEIVEDLRNVVSQAAVRPELPAESSEPPKPRVTSEQSPAKTPPKQTDDIGQASAKTQPRQMDEASKKQGEKSFVGTINFDIDKGNAALYRRFKEALSKVPGLEISMAEDSSKDRAHIVAFASRSILLMNILHQMSLVKSATAEKGTIEVVLQEADRWVG
jgi:hypothetical protein